MAARGLVATPWDVEDFLVGQMTWSVLPGDGVALLNSHRAAGANDLEALTRIDQLLWALKLPSEIRATSVQFGRRLLAETGFLGNGGVRAGYADMVTRRESPGNGAVALGIVAHGAGIGAGEALLVLCHGHAVSVLGAAMRLLPMSHTDAQGILGRLHMNLEGTMDEIRNRSWEEMTSFCPRLDIMSMCHESDDLRVFAS